MKSFPWRRWLKKFLPRKGQPFTRAARYLPGIEQLETRTVPAPLNFGTYAWTGAAGDGKWSTGSNWSVSSGTPTNAQVLNDFTQAPGNPAPVLTFGVVGTGHTTQTMTDDIA